MMFLFVWLLMSCIVCMIFYIKMSCWYLKAFPNYHSVCHQTTNVHVPISTYGGSNQWWTCQLIAQSHWIISWWLKRMDHAVRTNVMFITLQVGRCNVLAMGNNTTINPPYNVMTNLSLGRSMLKLHCILCVFV